jgi:hypothetical protein
MGIASDPFRRAVVKTGRPRERPLLPWGARPRSPDCPQQMPNRQVEKAVKKAFLTYRNVLW